MSGGYIQSITTSSGPPLSSATKPVKYSLQEAVNNRGLSVNSRIRRRCSHTLRGCKLYTSFRRSRRILVCSCIVSVRTASFVHTQS
jgi:hypothetical protein